MKKTERYVPLCATNSLSEDVPGYDGAVIASAMVSFMTDNDECFRGGSRDSNGSIIEEEHFLDSVNGIHQNSTCSARVWNDRNNVKSVDVGVLRNGFELFEDVVVVHSESSKRFGNTFEVIQEGENDCKDETSHLTIITKKNDCDRISTGFGNAVSVKSTTTSTPAGETKTESGKPGPICWKCRGCGQTTSKMTQSKRKLTKKGRNNMFNRNCSNTRGIVHDDTNDFDHIVDSTSHDKITKKKHNRSVCNDEAHPLEAQHAITNNTTNTEIIGSTVVSAALCASLTLDRCAKSATIATAVSSTTSERTVEKQCPICNGQGRLPETSWSTNNQGNFVVVTRGRRWSVSPGILPLENLTVPSSLTHTFSVRRPRGENNICRGPQPFAYRIPIYGTLVQTATDQLRDVVADSGLNDKERQVHKQLSLDSTSSPLLLSSYQHPRGAQPPAWFPDHTRGEQLCNLVGTWRILQRTKSHRWTTDDIVTATVASKVMWDMHHKNYLVNNLQFNKHNNVSTMAKHEQGKIRYLDLGTGNGSVLQMVLWSSYFLSVKTSSNNSCNNCNQGVQEVVTKCDIDIQQPQEKPPNGSDTPNDCSSHNSNSTDLRWESILTSAIGVEARREAVGLARRSIEFNLGIPTTSISHQYYHQHVAQNANIDSTTVHSHPKIMAVQVKPITPLVGILHSDFRSFLLDKTENKASAVVANVKTETTYQDVAHASDAQTRTTSPSKITTGLDTSSLYDLITGTPPYFRVDFTVRHQEADAQRNKNNTYQNKLIVQDVNNCTLSRDSCQNTAPSRSHTNSPNLMENKKSCSTSNNAIVFVEAATIRQGGMPLSRQSAPARCEFRGGIEEYCHVASQLLQPITGRFVVCINYINHHRALTAFQNSNLHVIQIHFIRGKMNRPILFCVYVLQKETNTDSTSISTPNDNILNTQLKTTTTTGTETHHFLAVRDCDGNWTNEYKEQVLQYMSIPT